MGNTYNHVTTSNHDYRNGVDIGVQRDAPITTLWTNVIIAES